MVNPRSGLTQSAEDVGSNFARDVELALPRRPRFPREIMVLPSGASGLLFVGANGTQVLNGRGARAFIPQLLPQLTGEFTIDEVQGRMPKAPANAVRNAVALMFSRGLLEDGPLQEVSPALAELASFVGRYADVTRVNKNRFEVLDRLAQCRVGLAGHVTLTESARDALLDQGLERLDVLDAPGDVKPGLSLLMVLVTGVDDAEAWFDAAHQAGVRSLHVRVGAGQVELGPLLVPGSSACYRCFREVVPAAQGLDESALGFWAGVAALRAFQLLSRVGATNFYNVCNLHLHDALGARHEQIKVSRLPGCACCGLGHVAARKGSALREIWQLHHASNSMPTRDLMSPRDYQYHYAATNIQITKERAEPFFGSQAQALPDGLSIDRPAHWLAGAAQAQAPDLNRLSTLLRYAVGYQPVPSGQRRIAPSGGGLGSAEFFVIARGLAGLDDGIYHYYAAEHQLERVREVNQAVLQGVLGLDADEMPPLVLVGVASLVKLRQKYGNFAFRFSNFDAGVVRVVLNEVSQALGLNYRELPDVRDKALASVLGLPTVGNRYTVTAAYAVGNPVPQGLARRYSIHRYMDTLVDLSSRVNVLAPRAVPPLAPLPEAPPTRHHASLEALLRTRTSCRDFARQPVPRDVLSFLCALAYDTTRWRTASGGLAVDMQLWVAITIDDPAGFSSGIYRWDGASGQLVQQRQGLVPEDLDPTMLQRSLARAPVVLMITGNFEQAVEAHGARGLREMFSRAASIAVQAQVATGYWDLAACPWGGLAEDAWGPLLNIDRYTACPLFGISLGTPASPAAPEEPSGD